MGEGAARRIYRKGRAVVLCSERVQVWRESDLYRKIKVD